MSLLNSESFNSTPLFKHAPLDHTQPSIRIIAVVPNLSEEGFVQCTLEHGSIDDDDYICLSYTWGDESTSYPILIDGQLFFVRQNLHSFLHVVRMSYPFRPLWIDAVCIDQCSITERNHQVAQMGAIYAAAAHVVVWLGNSNNITQFFRLWNQRDESESRVSWWMRMREELERVKTGWIEFATHTYWTRAWITQEIAHSRVLSLLADVVEVEDLRLITRVPWFAAAEIDERFRTHINIAQNHRTILGTRLSSALQRLPDQECQNGRDRIYALRGIVAEGSTIPVDYGSSDEDFLHMLLKTCGELRCLCGFELLSNTLGHMQALSIGTTAETHLIRFALVPSRAVVQYKNSRYFDFPMNAMCAKQPGSCNLEVSDLGEKEEHQQIGRFTRSMIPGYKTWCLDRGLCFFQRCTCQQPRWPGLNLHAKRGVYFEQSKEDWQPDIGATHQKVLSWHRRVCSELIVSNWFRVVLHTNKIVEGTGSYHLDVPLAALWSYAHQFKAFQESEAHFRSGYPAASLSRRWRPSVQQCRRAHTNDLVVVTTQQPMMLDDVWLREGVDTSFRQE